MEIVKVLYAEDEFTNRKIVEYQFKKYGILCDLALDGNEALDLYKKNTYQLIILDQYMPGLNGDMIATIIKKENPYIPLIAITSDDGEVVKLKKAGFNEVFIKPLRINHYQKIIKTYLEKK